MPHTKNEPSRLDLYKAGKVDERRSFRPLHDPATAENNDEEKDVNAGFRPEVIALAILVILLLILTAIAI